MKFDFTKPILAIDGTAMKSGSEADAPDLVLKDVCIYALITPHPKLADEDFQKKVKRFDLACRIRDHATECQIEASEVILLKQSIGLFYAPTVCGPVEHLLEGGASVNVAKREASG